MQAVLLFVQVVFVVFTDVTAGCANDYKNYTFPPDFIFGAATSAYQIEGAWITNGKCLNVEDVLLHLTPSLIKDGSNGDVACDSYHKYKDDVKMLKDIGVQFYRFSISWTRLMSLGGLLVNPDGLRYYNALIDELLANGIQPMVTLLHFDEPFFLHLLGGLKSSLFVTCFLTYAKVAFDNFGDRVKYWITFNEPVFQCQIDAVSATKTNYLCGYYLLLAHAKTYHLYNDSYRAKQGGKISLSLSSSWYEPGSNSSENVAAAERAQQFELGMYANPIFSKDGDFPDVVKQYVRAQSTRQWLWKSRLPEFTKEEIQLIKGTADFLGLNHYTSFKVNYTRNDSLEDSKEIDAQVTLWDDPSWKVSKTAYWLKYVPVGFRKLLKWIRDKYGSPDVIVTENGYSDGGELYDLDRIKYHIGYMGEMLNAMVEDGVKVKGYTVWSLMDNFEWLFGYTSKFGLYYVNFTDPNRPRTEKSSVKFYRDIINTRTLGGGKFCSI